MGFLPGASGELGATRWRLRDLRENPDRWTDRVAMHRAVATSPEIASLVLAGGHESLSKSFPKPIENAIKKTRVRLEDGDTMAGRARNHFDKAWLRGESVELVGPSRALPSAIAGRGDLEHRNQVEGRFCGEVSNGRCFSRKIDRSLYPALLTRHTGKISPDGSTDNPNARGIDLVSCIEIGNGGLEILGSGVRVVEIRAAERSPGSTVSPNVVGQGGVTRVAEGLIIGSPLGATPEALMNENHRWQLGPNPCGGKPEVPLNIDVVGGGERNRAFPNLGGICPGEVFGKIGFTVAIAILQGIGGTDGVEKKGMLKLEEIVDAIPVTVAGSDVGKR